MFVCHIYMRSVKYLTNVYNKTIQTNATLNLYSDQKCYLHTNVTIEPKIYLILINYSIMNIGYGYLCAIERKILLWKYII